MSIIEFPNPVNEDDLFSVDVDSLDAAGLRTFRQQVEEAIRAMDDREPKNTASAAYDEWAEGHEFLEDILDDVLDRLEEIGE